MNEIIDFDLIDSNIRNGVYQCIGSGSGRIVYDLENDYVVKVAKNNKGIAQNKVENHISLSDHSSIYAKVIKVSEDFRMLIMEKAVHIKDFSEVRRYFNVQSNRELFQVQEIRHVLINHSILLNDLYRTANWGMINNRPVIIDYGFTQAVRRKYYSPFNLM